MKIRVMVLAILMAFNLAAQSEKDSTDNSFAKKLFFSGNFGLQFGDVTNVEISPVAGYHITNRLSAGLGITYIYFRQKIGNFDKLETNVYGYRLFARQSINQQLFIQAEYENLSLELLNPLDNTTFRDWVPGTFIGGGFFQPVSENVGFTAVALYNVTYDDLRSPYNNPLVVRVGIMIGF